MKTFHELIGELIVTTEEIFHESRKVIQSWLHFDGIKNEKLAEALVSSYQGSRSFETLENLCKILYELDLLKIDGYEDFKKAYNRVVEVRNNIVHGKLTCGEMVIDEQNKVIIEGKKIGTKYKTKSFAYTESELIEILKLCKTIKQDVSTILLITIKELYPNQVLCDLTLKSKI